MYIHTLRSHLHSWPEPSKVFTDTRPGGLSIGWRANPVGNIFTCSCSLQIVADRHCNVPHLRVLFMDSYGTWAIILPVVSHSQDFEVKVPSLMETCLDLRLER
jgi:hypothetical protein